MKKFRVRLSLFKEFWADTIWSRLTQKNAGTKGGLEIQKALGIENDPPGSLSNKPKMSVMDVIYSTEKEEEDGDSEAR